MLGVTGALYDVVGASWTGFLETISSLWTSKSSVARICDFVMLYDWVGQNYEYACTNEVVEDTKSQTCWGAF